MQLHSHPGGEVKAKIGAKIRSLHLLLQPANTNTGLTYTRAHFLLIYFKFLLARITYLIEGCK